MGFFHSKIQDDIISCDYYVGKKLVLLSNMRVPNRQGSDNHGLKIIYFEKQYLIIGAMVIDTFNQKYNVCKQQILDQLDLKMMPKSKSMEEVLILCDNQIKSQKLPDPQYINKIGSMKFITLKNFKKCLNQSHCNLK